MHSIVQAYENITQEEKAWMQSCLRVVFLNTHENSLTKRYI